MTRYRRWNELLELLAAEGQLQVEEAAKALGVSEATVRRDLDELARQQMLTRIRGGAVAQGVTYDLPLRYKSEKHPSEKQRIAAVAAALVRPGQVVGLNGGTTTTKVERASTSSCPSGPPGSSSWPTAPRPAAARSPASAPRVRSTPSSPTPASPPTKPPASKTPA